MLKIVLLKFLTNHEILLSYESYDVSNIKTQDEKNLYILDKVVRFFKKHSHLKKDIHLNLPITNSVFTKTVKLPQMPKREILNAAKLHLKNEVPCKISELVFAWDYIYPQGMHSRAGADIICVAVKKDFVLGFVKLLRKANILVSGITFSPFNISNIMSADDGWRIVLDVGYKQSVFSFHSKGKVLFLRTIHVGAQHFQSREIFNNNSEQKAYIEHLGDEIVRSLKYCEIEFTKTTLNSVYITGGGAKIINLIERLKEATGLDIKVLRFPRNMQIDHELRSDFEKTRASLQILPAVGAALKPAENLDVLPIEAKAERLISAQKISFRLAGLTLLLVLLLSYFAVKLDVGIYEKKLQNAKSELIMLKEAEVFKTQIDAQKSTIQQIKKNNIPPEWTLKYISSIIPSNAELTIFSLDAENRTVDLRGFVYAKGVSAEDAVTEFVHNLKQIPVFSDAQLVSLEKTADGPFVFVIECALVNL